ncbi:ComF family protein [Aquimarina brevivitae]|uniref:ComF family protein n=1 Tax=Aquimarina brevivitae TaxID=323412 RepID=A0A4Q7PHW5_9FLAO|nr:phosphoribosyltransferase family protein [Aquimarina brevivitae]RZS99400.1 ComF family protein [Aquimarina brevivitae]
MLRDLVYLFFPYHCPGCHNPMYRNEGVICMSCRHKLPLGNFHNVNAKKLEKVFYGRANIENATSLLIFQKGTIVQNILHDLKYRGNQRIGEELGKWLGDELKLNARYTTVDTIIPVPLHKKRFKERGYNQVEKFGKQIAERLQASYEDRVLIKTTYNKKQSKSGRFTRWINASETFAIKNKSLLENQHVLLVDDIITTGSTLEACVEQLKKIKNIKISIATMAFTDEDS